MPNAATIAAIRGAVEIFLGRRDGLRRFDLSVEGFWRSFAAILYVLPLFAIVVAADWMMVSGQPAHPSREAFILARLVDLAIEWCTLPIALGLLAKRLGIGRTYVAYVVARNWSGIVSVAPLALLSLLFGLGALSLEVMELLSLLVIGAMLFYGYRIARWTLVWPASMAAGLVAADLALSLILLSLVNSLFGF